MILFALLAAATPIQSNRVDALFAAVARPGSPGCVVDVRRGNEVLIQRAYGVADLETGRPINEATIFEAGSASKQFVGALLAILAERGVVSFDDSVRHWLPELPAPYQPITLAMLLHHTSGIRDWSALVDVTGWSRGQRAYGMDDVLALLAHQRTLNFAPGTEYLYSNSNYILAARIAERASGRTLQDLSQAELFGPLGMTRTGWRDDFHTVVPSRAQAYSTGDDDRWLLDMPFETVVGPGGLLTTTSDLQRWTAALGAVGLPWMRRMIEPGLLADGTRVPYGLGVQLSPVNGHDAVSHAGATAGYRAWAGRFPSDGLAVALLCNAGSLNTEELGPEVAAVFLPPVSTSVAGPGARPPAALAGTYRNVATDAAVDVRIVDGMLSVGGSRYAYREGSEHQDVGGSVFARMDERGQVKALDITRSGNGPARLQPAARWQPDAVEITSLVGRYHSPEVDADVLLTTRGGQLHWVDPRGASIRLEPTITDTFAAWGWQLRIIRDRRGRPTGLRGSTTRARQLLFSRQRAT